MVSIKSMKVASFTLGLLGIMASLFILGDPRPHPDVFPGSPSAKTCLYTPTNATDFPWLRTPTSGTYIPSSCKWGRSSRMKCHDWGLPWAKGEEFSFKKCLQWILYFDVGFWETVDEALEFPYLVLLTSFVHILAHLSLLCGVFQAPSCFLMVFIVYYIVTTIGFLIAILLASYESLLVAMCLIPMESCVILLYGNTFFLPLSISAIKAILFFCTIVLQEKMDDVKKKIKPASGNKTQVDFVYVIPV